jgi:hypothetical protein
MENTNSQARIRAYLDGKMSNQERRAFEEELQHDASLQKALLQTALQPPPPASASEIQVRAIAGQLREKSPLPPQPPKITPMDHWNHTVSPLAKAAVFVGVLMMSLLTWVNVINPPRPIAELPDNHFIELFNLNQAGNGKPDTNITAAMAIYEKANRLYFRKPSGWLDSLKQLAASTEGFNMANFHLAHGYLKEGKCDEARAEFKLCLDNREFLSKFSHTSDIKKIELNYLLAELCAFGKSDKLMADLKALIDSTPEKNTVHKEAQALHDELTNPLRIFSFR